MTSRDIFLLGTVIGDCIVLHDTRHSILPQLEPTSPRIKGLLSKGLMAPETLTPAEVQEMTASVVYYLIMKTKE